MKYHDGHRDGGFTIIETMIVFTVTMVILASVYMLINGKQRATAFNQSINSIQTELLQVVNDVSSGYYNGTDNIDCNGASGLPVITAGASGNQGTHQSCVFLGKALQFWIHDTDPQQYNVYTLAGINGSAYDFAAAKARPIACATTDVCNPPSAAGVPNNAFESRRLLYGLKAVKMYYDNDIPAHEIGAVAFAAGQVAAGTGDGAEQVSVAAIPNTELDRSTATGATQIKLNLATSILNPPGGVSICFESGGTNQSGLITIGASGRLADVDLKVFNSADCT